MLFGLNIIQMPSFNITTFDSGRYGFLARTIILALITILAAYLLPGVHISSLKAAIITGLVIALLDNFIRPILIFIGLPFIVMSLGLVLIVINALIILMAGSMVKGFEVEGFGSAICFSLIIAVVNYVMEWVRKRIEQPEFETPQQNVPEEEFSDYEEVSSETNDTDYKQLN